MGIEPLEQGNTTGAIPPPRGGTSKRVPDQGVMAPGFLGPGRISDTHD